MRFPRFFTKKRGDRRTDSHAWGSFAEGLFYALLVGAGGVFGLLLVTGAVSYAPADPDSVVLQRGYEWWMWLLTLLIPLALLAFGGSGLVRVLRTWGKSQEHRAAGSRTVILDGLAGAPPAIPGHPGVPSCDNLENSPGIVLRYRLPLESPENWTLVGLGLFALLWNAVVVVLAVGVGADLIGGTTDWLLIGLLVPFVAVGVGGVVLFVRAAILSTSVGPTHVEISDHPLVPGMSYDVRLGQGGAHLFRSIDLGLELEETATFRQGTDTRTQRLVVRRVPVSRWQKVQPVPGGSFEARVAVTIPADAMHSFSSENNAVQWRIVVRALPDRWPEFTRVFPVVVLPVKVVVTTAICDTVEALE
jgi:hypothetical protein